MLWVSRAQQWAQQAKSCSQSLHSRWRRQTANKWTEHVKKYKICSFALYMLLFKIGVCLGMQLAVIEFARNCLNLKGKSQIYLLTFYFFFKSLYLKYFSAILVNYWLHFLTFRCRFYRIWAKCPCASGKWLVSLSGLGHCHFICGSCLNSKGAIIIIFFHYAMRVFKIIYDFSIIIFYIQLLCFQ